MIYGLYNVLLTLTFLLAWPLVPLLLLGKRFRHGFLQRISFYPRDIRESQQKSRPVWIHAVSVGEVLAARFLAAELKAKFPDRKILFSTFTSTGFETARRAVSAADAFIFFPLDQSWVVRRSLTLFNPCLIIFLETEIWPNFLRQAYRRGIPTLLLSGRLSRRAFGRYSFFRPFFSRVVKHFTALGLQSEEDSERLIRLGVNPRKIWITGNLKQAPWAGAELESELEREERSMVAEGRQILVAGSTHRGEEEIFVDVFLALKARFPGLLMVLAPRHPQRFAEVEKLLVRRRVRYEKKSQMNSRVAESTDVIFLDTLGDLISFYSLADVAFVGGSLVDAGGHNIVEPARFRKPILFGPYTSNCAGIAEEMKRTGGGIEVRGKDDIVREIAGLLADGAKAKKVGELAYCVTEKDHGVLDRSIRLVSRYLQR